MRAIIISSLLVHLYAACVIGAAEVDFRRDVLPLLEAKCIACHGPETQESQLRLDSMTAALRGGDSGESIIRPGQSATSHLIERITSPNPALRMPPDDADPLSADEIGMLKVWIDQETGWHAAREALLKNQVTHWSFQPIVRPALPAVEVSHPLDAFVVATLSQHRLMQSPVADRRQRVRRLYLVMHGLPPTPEEVDTFVNDQRLDAWSRLVERVLSSPRFGERMASPWLDLIRFGETYGFETNRERPTAYPFRDWVIEAFNSDKPYDQFVRQQLAGDLLGEPIGTGFLVAGPNDIVKGQDALLGLMQRQDELTDIVNATGTAFLALTTGCARCHNHKFDPITQSDFYALQAIFAGVHHGDQQLPLAADKLAVLDVLQAESRQLSEQLARYVPSAARREAVNAQQNTESFPRKLVKSVRFHIEATNSGEPCIDELEIYSGGRNVALNSQGATLSSSGNFDHPLHKLEHLNDGLYGNSRSWIANSIKGSWVQIDLAKPYEIDRIVWQRDRDSRFKDRLAIDYRIEATEDGIHWKEIAGSRDRQPFLTKGEPLYQLDGLSPAERMLAEQQIARIKTLKEQQRQILASAKVYSGVFTAPGPTRRLFRGEPQSPREEIAPGTVAALGGLTLDNDSTDSIRRLALAEWITSPDNPLTARVIVNRIWQFHFGTGIVDTPSDFGANGTEPSHPEMLDWLASELIEHRWSLKHIHRLILTSHTWQQDSRPNAEGLDADAATRWLWRYPPRRLDAEGIRDGILAAAGQLSLTSGGPGFSAFEIELENVRHYFPKKDFGPEDWRRMVYMTKVRNERDAIFGLFDCPDASQVTPKRTRSTTPLQALNLLNSRFVLQQSELYAKRLGTLGTPLEQVHAAYRSVLGRLPDDDELQISVKFVQQSGLVEFCRALFNTNEFTFIP